MRANHSDITFDSELDALRRLVNMNIESVQADAGKAGQAYNSIMEERTMMGMATQGGNKRLNGHQGELTKCITQERAREVPFLFAYLLEDCDRQLPRDVRKHHDFLLAASGEVGHHLVLAHHRLQQHRLTLLDPPTVGEPLSPRTIARP